MADIKERADNLGQTVRDQAGKVADKAKDATANVVGAVRDTFQDATKSASEMASKAADQVRGTAKEWMGNAEDAAKNAAKTVQHVASDAADKVGDLGEDLTHIIQRNPIPSVLAAMGIGFLAAVALRRNSSS